MPRKRKPQPNVEAVRAPWHLSQAEYVLIHDALDVPKKTYAIAAMKAIKALPSSIQPVAFREAFDAAYYVALESVQHHQRSRR